jgi:putative component of membrane protein insertase Oxa1/YidC/SpoIIIJ protein YidD
MDETRVVVQHGAEIELRVDPRIAPAVLRHLIGATPMDQEVDALPLPEAPFWRRAAVRSLRWYRSGLGIRLKHRCVLEPSCSRYAELAFRQRGPVAALALTIRRLWKCRPSHGGVGIPAAERKIHALHR